MADNLILTPGFQEENETPEIPQVEEKYLIIKNALSELASEENAALARSHLGVPHIDNVYSKLDVDTRIGTAIGTHLNTSDPHGILPKVEEMVEGTVKSDGSTPFTEAQSGVIPIKDEHLTTKKYVDNEIEKSIKKHEDAEDPHHTLDEVEYLLEKYAKLADVYSRTQLYTKQEIDNQSKNYIKKDGSTPFTIPQIGADPQIDSHLATKRYVDKSLYNHNVEVDPHGLISILNQRLASYAKNRDVYDKTQTYSRTQIDSILHKLVDDTIDTSLQGYMDKVDDKFEDIRLQKYIKQDGSIPFKKPQSGVDAIEEEHLTTLRQLNQAISTLEQSITEQIGSKECVWKTSGPVESTVGHVEDNTPVPETMTLQEVCDAIFYGKGINLEVPEYVVITEKCPVTMCVHGSTGLIQYAELYQNGELIYTLQKEDFEDGCVTVDSLPLQTDAEFTFKVYYTNGSVHEVSETVKCYMPVFVGLLPKWKTASTITMDYLVQLCKEDPDGTQNRFLNQGKDLSSFTFRYQFQDPQLRHPFIVIPESYPNLESMVTSSQKFGIDAFDVVNMIPLSVPGVEEDIIFKIYVYRQALSSLNQDVTFNFEQE